MSTSPLLIIDRKKFWLMSTRYQTCRVTNLNLLQSDEHVDGCIQVRESHRKCSGVIKINSERPKEFQGTGNVFDNPNGLQNILEGSIGVWKVLENT